MQLKLNCTLRNIYVPWERSWNSLMIRNGVGSSCGNRKPTGMREDVGARTGACVERDSVTNDGTIRYLEDRDTCLGEEVSPVVSRSNYNGSAYSALSLQVERDFFLALYNSPFPRSRARYYLRGFSDESRDGNWIRGKEEDILQAQRYNVSSCPKYDVICMKILRDASRVTLTARDRRWSKLLQYFLRGASGKMYELN